MTGDKKDQKDLDKMIQEGFKAIQSHLNLDLSRDPFPELRKPASPDNWKKVAFDALKSTDLWRYVLLKDVLDALRSMDPWRYVLLFAVAFILFLFPFPDWFIFSSIKNAVYWADLTVLGLFFLLLFSSKIRADNRPLSKKERGWLKRTSKRAGKLVRNPNQERSVQLIYNEVSSVLENNNKLADEGRATIKSVFLSLLVRSYAISRKGDCTFKFYDELLEFRTRFPSNKPILVAWTLASPLVPPFCATNKQIEIERARKIYDDSVDLNSVYSEDKRFLKSLCVASVNMIAVYGQAKEVDKAQAIYDKLVGITGEHLGKQNWIKRVLNKQPVRYVRKLAGGAELRETKLSLATGSASMIVVYWQAKEVNKARKAYDMLVDFSDQNSEDKVGWEVLAKGCVSMILVCVWAPKPDLEKAPGVYDRLVALFDKRHEDKEVRKQLAWSSLIMITVYALERRVKEAQDICDKVIEWARKYPDYEELQNIVANIKQLKMLLGDEARERTRQAS